MTLDTFMNTQDVLVSEVEPENKDEVNPFDGITSEERDARLKENEKNKNTGNRPERGRIKI